MMERRTKQYEDFLMILLFNRYVDISTLNLTDKNKSLVTKRVHKAVSLDHIKRKSIVTRKNGFKRTQNAYHLTRKGLDYLIQNSRYEWFNLIDPEIARRIVLIRDSEYSAEALLKITAQSNANIFARMTGAKTDFSTYSENYCFSDRSHYSGKNSEETVLGKITFLEYLKDQLPKELYQEMPIYQDVTYNGVGNTDRIVYYSGTAMKSKAGLHNRMSRITDFSMGRFRGIAETEEKSILMYVAPQFGMTWGSWINKKEMDIYDIWMQHKKERFVNWKGQRESYAAIIVDNAKDFGNLYQNKYMGKSGTQVDEGSIGGLFTHCYILPNNWDGINQFRWLLLSNREQTIDSIRKMFLQTGDFTPNKTASCRSLCLRDAYNQETALGFELDVQMVKSVNRIALWNPDEAINIFCFDWQVDFYQRVVPENVNIISSNFLTGNG